MRKHSEIGSRRIAFQTFGQGQVLRRLAQQLLRVARQQPLPGAIHQLQALFVVEGEHRHVDLRHHLAEQGMRFQGPQLLFAKHFGELVDPETGKTGRDLMLAKHTIDTLGMLKEKTAGNLTMDESNLLETVLYDLKLRFVNSAG